MASLGRCRGVGLALAVSLAAVVGPGAVNGSVAAAAECSSVDFAGSPTPPLLPSCFEAADGDMTASGRALDWQSVAGGPGAVIGDSSGGSDDVFQGGSKEEDPTSWAIVHQPTPASGDILSVGRYVDPLTSDEFVYLGSILLSPSGGFHESFELNQSGPLGGLPVRTAGDVLLSFDTNGGTATVGMCRWQGDKSSGQWTLLDGTAVDNTNDKACTPLTAATPSAQGALNTSAIPASSNYISGVDVEAGDFGELSVDLTRALESATGGRCVTFSSWWLRTRSSIQVPSDPKDFVAPQALDVSNCPPPPTPLPPAGTGSPPTADHSAPVVSAVSSSARTWRLGTRLPRFSRTVPVGTTISFQVSEPAKATLTFARAEPGRKVGRHCVAPTRRNRHRRHCTRQVLAGTISMNAPAGLNRVQFDGRLSRHKTLRPGRHTLTITATDAAGNRSTSNATGFTVLPRR